jgi:hypothetical protein
MRRAKALGYALVATPAGTPISLSRRRNSFLEGPRLSTGTRLLQTESLPLFHAGDASVRSRELTSCPRTGGVGNVLAPHTYGGSMAHQAASTVLNIRFGYGSITVAPRRASPPAGGAPGDWKCGSSLSGDWPAGCLTISGTRDEPTVDAPGEDAPVGMHLSPRQSLPNHWRRATYIRWCGRGEAVRHLSIPTRRPI